MAAKLTAAELLESQAHIWNQMYCHLNSMTLLCAIKLEIPDIINKHGKAMKLSELLNALPKINKSKHQCIRRIMRNLVHSKFFTSVKEDEDEDESYTLTPSSRLLLKEEPMSIAPYVLGVLTPFMLDPLHNLSEWLTSETTTPFVFTHGKEFWEYAAGEPKLNKQFNKAMDSDSALVGNVVMEKCKHVFEGFTSMVDVAGGTGAMAKIISDAWPELKCTVLDLPHVVAGLEGTENVTFVGGSMFDSIPSADLLLLKWILHDWCDEECVKILKKCKEAIPKEKGKLIIIDIVVDLNDDNKTHAEIEAQLFLDIVMMKLYQGGKERTEKEWANIIFQAGFTTYKITPVLGLRSIIEVYP